jgi:lipoprotein NlpD
MGTRPRTESLRGRARAALLLLALLPLGCMGPQAGAPVEKRTVRDEPLAKVKRAPEAGGRAVAPPAPREQGDWRPESYTVQRGDTLYSIALDHGLDYRELASWNDLADPNVIRVDQKLRLHAPPGWQPPPEPVTTVASVPPPSEIEAKPLTPPPGEIAPKPLPPPAEIEAKPLAPLMVKTGPKAVKLAYSAAALAQLRGESIKPATAPATKAVATAKPTPAAPAKSPPATPPPAASVGNPPVPATSKPTPATAETTAVAGWIWPTNGPLLHAFNEGSNPKGVAIGGEPGQAIVASAAGKVVYSGSGLRGYGKLIIIKHSDTYLSVYAHNKTLLVKEGERVAKGQKIAEMGDSDSQIVSLHFEIRRLGKPVDPLQYLPEGGAS